MGAEYFYLFVLCTIPSKHNFVGFICKLGFGDISMKFCFLAILYQKIVYHLYFFLHSMHYLFLLAHFSQYKSPQLSNISLMCCKNSPFSVIFHNRILMAILPDISTLFPHRQHNP